MSMLERTAASLEPCNFHRALPVTSSCLKSHRKLHTAFWQHGAANIELSNAWQTLVRGPFESLDLFSTPRTTRTESLTASTFLLDFLYPQGAAALLRKLSPSAFDRYERPRFYPRSPAGRLFSSLAALHHDTPSEAQNTEEQYSVQDGHVDGNEDSHDSDADASRDEATHTRDAAADKLPVVSKAKVTKPWDQPHFKLNKLRGLLEEGDSAKFDEIFSLYHSTSASKMLTEEDQALGRQLCDYAIKSRGLTEPLIRALKQERLPTVYALWSRYPEEERKANLDLDQLEPAFSSILGKLTTSLKTLCGHGKTYNRTGDRKMLKSLRESFIVPLVQKYLARFELDDAAYFVEQLQAPLLSEDFIRHCLELKQYEQAAKMYKIYRKIPDVKVRVKDIIHPMIKHVFMPQDGSGKVDPTGMEMAKEDWYGRYGKLDTWGYHKYLPFYASRGDVKEVKRLREEFLGTRYTQRDRQQVLKHDAVYWISWLHVHAVRGDLDEVRRIFDETPKEMEPRLGIRPWNVMLNAHAKAGEYGAAVRFFGVLRESVVPDVYTFGTMMGMSGSRGDLEYTIELYRDARDMELQPNAAMVDSVVEAYCQNDKFGQAEDITTMTTKTGRLPPEQCTVLWNTLLFHHAHRRDLSTINRLLNQMTELEVPYDSETYDNLLRCLALCQQPHHAFYLLKVAMQEHQFRPTHNHFVLLMFAFIRAKIPAATIKTSGVIDGFGFPQTAQALLRVSEALGAYAGAYRGQSPAGKAELDENPRRFLAIALRGFRELVTGEPEAWKAPKSDYIEPPKPVITGAAREDQAALLIFFFAQLKDFSTVQEVVDIWRLSSPANSTDKEPPLKLVNALMTSSFYDEKYDEVKEAWQLAWATANEMARPRGVGIEGSKLPGRHYIMNDTVRTMSRMYAATGDHEGLRSLVTTVTNAGFKLNSKNWNYYVQILATMQRWKDAFTVCEKHLMAQWTGWKRVRTKQPVPNQIPLELRRMGSAPRILRPITHTLLVLAKAYMDLEQMAAWSGEAGRLFRTICETCPKVVGAVTTMVRANSAAESRILDGVPINEDPQVEQVDAMQDFVAQERALMAEWRDSEGNVVVGWADEHANVDTPKTTNRRGRRKIASKTQDENGFALVDAEGRKVTDGSEKTQGPQAATF